MLYTIGHKNQLQNRVLFHLAEKVSLCFRHFLSFPAIIIFLQSGDHEVLMKHHHSLQNIIEDQVLLSYG